MEIEHVPVMLTEVVGMMRTRKSGVYIDGTVGSGGHAEGILLSVKGECTVIGIDKDMESLKEAELRLKGFDVMLVRESFTNMDAIAGKLGYEKVDGILLDLGVSTLQLKREGKGFSFLKDETLDMRMDNRQTLTALKVVNEYSESDLADVLWRYGEERSSRKVARAVIEARKRGPITTCRALARIVEEAVGRGRKKRHEPLRIHPATKTFQALRIEVNRELAELSMAINSGMNILAYGGRFCILSYHSLEDRIVKRSFRDLAQRGLVTLITKKPLVPSEEERELNPSARSAKLRVAERI